MFRISRTTFPLFTAAMVAFVLSTGGSLAQDVHRQLDAYLPQASELPDAYSSEASGPQPNEQLQDWWGTEVFDLLVASGREAGWMRMYDLEATEAEFAPSRLLVVIERFATPEGAEAFFSTSFPGGFRGGLYDSGEPLELADEPGRDLSAADAGLVMTQVRGEGDDATHMLNMNFRYREFSVLVQGWSGETITDQQAQYMKGLAAMILSNLVAASG